VGSSSPIDTYATRLSAQPLRYLNFYAGLLSAILAVTLTGLLSLAESSLNPYLKLSLLLGPMLTIALSRVGYPILMVPYRRFLEAWITTINIRAMLGLKDSITLDEGISQPVYKGKYDNGFIAEFDARDVASLQLLRRAAEEESSAEEVLKNLSEGGGQPWMARTIFNAFQVAAIILSVVITIAVLLSNQSPPN
jgi:hypothetical protein